MANYLVIGGDGKQYGPVTTEELRAWMNEGRLNGQSMIRAEESTEWKPLASFPELAMESAPPPLAAPGSVPTSDWQSRVLSREPELRVGECLNGGMGFLLSNLGFVVASVLLAWFANFAMAVFPLIGGLIHLLFGGVVLAGLYFAVLRRMRGEEVSAGNIFDGFKMALVPLMLVGTLSKILTQIGFMLCMIPGIYLVVAWVFGLPLVMDKRLEFWSALELSRKMVTRVWFKMALLMFIAFLPFLLGQGIMTAKVFSYFLTVWNEVNRDPVAFLNWLSKHMNDLLKEMFWTALIVQLALLVSQFLAVGVLMRAYENLFGERKN